MDNRQRARWAVLLSALAATIGAIAYPTDELAVAPRSVTVASAVIPTVQPKIVERPREWIASDVDPFAPHGWSAAQPVSPLPPPPPPPAPLPSTDSRGVTPVQLTETPAPPPIPFKFLGQMIDGKDRIVYLGMGEQVLLARVGDVLEGTYKVIDVRSTQVQFELLASGVRQTLPLPAQEH